MKRIPALLLAVAALPSVAFAGEIYGTVKENGKPVAEGVGVSVACGDKSASATTDKAGSYRVFAAQEGKCTLTVKVGGESPSTVIHSYVDSARYNLVLEKKGGKYTVRTE